MPEHRFCWADLATVDDVRAAAFYAALFGWSPRSRTHAAGRFTILEHEGEQLASLFRLAPSQVASGVPSHWLPYVSTRDLAGSLARARALGGEVVVAPQRVPALASFAVVVDPVGALVGLWQSDERAERRVRVALDDESRTGGDR